MVKSSGYIEGYFGRELTWEQRYGIIDHLHTLSMNTFFYAPKEDPYHRIQWKTSYPPFLQKQLKKFSSYGKKKNVEIIPALAPGLSFDYTSEEDYTLLLKKFYIYFKMGINTIALLMDDIPEDLPSSCNTHFSSLGEAHGKLLNRLLKDLRKKNKKVKLWFCPTIYTDEFVSGKAVDCQYIKDLSITMPSSITLMWTGQQVVSEKLNQKTIGDILKLFNGNVVIWDNIWANDYAPMRIFLGPYLGREGSIIKNTKGLLINPTGLYHTDKFLLSLFGDFLKSKKVTVSGWDRVADEYDISPLFYKIRKFFWSSFFIVPSKYYSKNAIDKYGNLYDDLIVDWQNPLKLEWFPFIQALNLNFIYLTKDKNDDCKTWIYKRYPSVIADRMVDSCK